MVNFNKVSWPQILTFSKVVSKSASLNIQTIKRWYNSESTNFDDTLIFYKELKLIDVRDRKIFIEPSVKTIFGLDERSIHEFFIEKLFKNKNSFSRYLEDFFINFYQSGNEFVYTPNLRQRLKFSGLRNLLIGLKVLNLTSPLIVM